MKNNLGSIKPLNLATKDHLGHFKYDFGFFRPVLIKKQFRGKIFITKTNIFILTMYLLRKFLKIKQFLGFYSPSLVVYLTYKIFLFSKPFLLNMYYSYKLRSQIKNKS